MKNMLFLDVAEELINKNKEKIDIKKQNGIETKHFKLTNKQRYKRDLGDYYTISFAEEILEFDKKYLTKEIIKTLKKFKKNITQYNSTLIIGLGNSSIMCDALGSKTASKIIATNHYVDFLSLPKVAVFAPEVISKTGISSFDLIKMLVHNLKPSLIIVIDSLATNNYSRLNNCIEISDTGIIPGSALMTNRKISSKTFNIPLIAIGAPLVLKNKNMILTSPNVKQVVDNLSTIIANALNYLFLK